MLKKILIALLVVIAGFLIYAQMRPDTYTIVRSATMAAAPSTVYPMIADFHQWPSWSPWEKLDPNMKRDMTGAESGVGAVYAWAGNSHAGEGKMTITRATPDQEVGIQLDFVKPMPSTCEVTFALSPAEGGTEVKWTMDGKHNFMSKVMCVFMDMDKMVGTDFEKGLAELKTRSEAAQAAAPADTTAASPQS